MLKRGPHDRNPCPGLRVGLLLAVLALGSPVAARQKPAKGRPLATSAPPALPQPVKTARPVPGKALAAFHRALEATRHTGSKTHVLFFGDSHTAADCLTGRLRERLQADYGDGGPGFLMPGKPWAYYYHGRAQILETHGLRPSYVRKPPERGAEPLGLSGVAFLGGDVEPVSLRMSVAGALMPTGRALHGELYFWRQPDGATLELLLDGQPLGAVVTAGEPGPGYADFDVPDDGQHEIELRGPAEIPVTLLGLVAELVTPGVVVDTLGVPGARARSQLFWEPTLFREHVRRRAPDLWVLAYGTNEATDVAQPIAEYVERLRQVIANLRAAAPAASCLLVGPTDFPERTKKRTYQVRERNVQINLAQRTVAAEVGCAFFDTMAAMGGPLAIVAWAKRTPPLAARDMIHLTRDGYAILGDAIADAILPAAVPTMKPKARGYGSR